MFTGIIQKLGKVDSNRNGKFCVKAALGRLPIGSSVAINGVCLTIIKGRSSAVEFDVSPETLHRTNLGALEAGDSVNVETPLKPTDMIGGHIVAGHIDAVAKILQIRRLSNKNVEMRISLPASLRKLVAEKGSIAVDGISLTVSRIGRNYFEAALIPHTLRHTTLGIKKVSDTVNLEADMLARYVSTALNRRK